MYDVNTIALGMAASNVMADVNARKSTGLTAHGVTLLNVTPYTEETEGGLECRGSRFQWNIPAIREMDLMEDFIALFPQWLGHVEAA